jgi:hypothetical protein
MHCNGNSTYIFLLWELRGLSPNFRIHVSVSDLYIPRNCGAATYPSLPHSVANSLKNFSASLEEKFGP